MKSAKIFLLLLFLILAFSRAEAAGLEGLPRVSSFEFRQMGATDLMIDIRGNDLPLPQVSNLGNRTYIVMPGVSCEGARQHTDEGMLPLVTAMRAGQTGQDFTITIMTERPIEPRAVRGIPPSDAYTLHLKTIDETQRLVEERVATDHPQTLRVPTGPFAANTPITMDLRDTELRDVFRMFGEQVKKNIVIHDSLPPILVTMTFRNSPLSNVFGYLMRNYDLSYEFIDNDTILVGTATGLARISGKEETRSYRIAYADPAAVASLLPNLTRVSDLVVDPRLRTIYATGTPDMLEEVAIVVQRLDNPGKQVLLHARILQFNQGDRLEVEHTLNMIYDRWMVSYGSGIIFADYNSRRDTDRQREYAGDFRALESRTGTRTLANPSVITIDGIEASVSLTQDYPYVSDRDDNQRPVWSNISTGPILRMTPRVGRDNVITLDLSLSYSHFVEMLQSGYGEEVPVTSKREVLTNVRVRNGEPFVVGGLFTTDNTNNRIRVPILGQLPLLGEIFTYRVRNSTTTQVVMIVIPYILDTPDVGVEYERVLVRQ